MPAINKDATTFNQICFILKTIIISAANINAFTKLRILRTFINPIFSILIL